MKFTGWVGPSGKRALLETAAVYALPSYREGLPIGVQLVAPYGREDLLIQVAAQLEQATPWQDRHPALFDGDGLDVIAVRPGEDGSGLGTRELGCRDGHPRRASGGLDEPAARARGRGHAWQRSYLAASRSAATAGSSG